MRWRSAALVLPFTLAAAGVVVLVWAVNAAEPAGVLAGRVLLVVALGLLDAPARRVP